MLTVDGPEDLLGEKASGAPAGTDFDEDTCGYEFAHIERRGAVRDVQQGGRPA
ncbi:MAG: hypothetical protein ACRDPW_10665 [Mycobacteriales bacterium]